MPLGAPGDPAPAQDQTYPVSVWDVGTGTVIQTLHQPLARSALNNGVAISRSGDLVAINNDAEIRVWRVDDGALVAQLPLGAGIGGMMQFSPDASLLGVIDREREVVQLWSLRNGSLVRTLETDARSWMLNDLAFSPDGQLLALYQGSTVTIWRVADGALQRTLESTLTTLSLTPSLAFSPDGHVLAVGGWADAQPTVAELWRVGDGVLLHTFRDTETYADSFWDSAVAFSADGTRLMTTTMRIAETDVALLWNVQDGRLLRRIDPAIGIRHLRFAPNDTEVLVTEWPYLFALLADMPAE